MALDTSLSLATAARSHPVLTLAACFALAALAVLSIVSVAKKRKV